MCIEGRFWNNLVGDTDDSPNLVAFLENGRNGIAENMECLSQNPFTYLEDILNGEGESS